MSEDKEFQRKLKKAEKKAYWALFFSLIASILLLFLVYDPSFSIFGNNKNEVLYSEVIEDEDEIKNGIHIRTGLIEAEGLMTVVNNCTNCHSSKLIVQNRMSVESWNATIKWMQKTQNLWNLGENQEIIVNYLVTNYPVNAKGRRMVLKDIDWYTLEN